MNELERYYEKINPSVTAEELTERIIAKAEKPKKRISSKFIGIAAAAAAVMTLGITTAAAGLGYLDVFGELFGERAENLTHNIVEEAEIIRNDTEKMDFELVAAAADKHGIMVIIDVAAKNGFKLGQNYLGDARADFWQNITSYPAYCEFSSFYVIEEDDLKSRVCIRYNSDEDITGSEILLALGEPQEERREKWTFADYENDKQWQVKFTAVDNSIEYEINGTEIGISPINVTFDGECQFINYGSNLKIITEKEIVNVTYNQVDIIKQDLPNHNYEKFAIFSIGKPINPEEVIALEINGRRFNLK